MEARKTREKLKNLLPYGMVATKKWLVAQGLSTHAIDNAVKSEALLTLTAGVYTQYSANVRWEGVVASLQTMTDKPVHLGGESALALAGMAHYLSLGKKQVIHLFSEATLPRWVARLASDTDINGRFIDHSTKRLWSEGAMNSDQYLKAREWQPDAPDVKYSCPEKAIMEVLANVPRSVSFDHADELMQGLLNLSPKKLDGLLLGCKSIRVKRLFFWLAARNDHQWFNKLNVQDYNLGAGKRVVAKDGKLDKKYMITVPKHM